MALDFHRRIAPLRGGNAPSVGFIALIGACIIPLLVGGCSGSDSQEGGTGGAIAATGATNGNPTQGGASSSGASTATGGASFGDSSLVVGGSAASGGTAATAGGEQSNTSSTGGSATPTGGSKATGGAGNVGGTKTGVGGVGTTGGTLSVPATTSTGGRVATGGAASGGSKSTGGTSSSGGTASNAGTKATGGSVASGGASNTAGATGCYGGPAAQVGTQAPGGSLTGYGTVMFWAKSPHQIVRLQTTMVVPPKPPATGTLFLWPGIQPDGANFLPIDNGVLQPVLTWGPSCAPGTQPREYSSWWISGQYVNTFGSLAGYTGCDGGPIMSVNVCDSLSMDMELSGTVWTQTVTDLQTSRTVTYALDMQSQAQNLAYFVIEEYSSAPVSEVIFTDTTLTFDTPDAADCKVNTRGKTDYVSTPVASGDGLQCSIQQIILRAQGIQ